MTPDAQPWRTKLCRQSTRQRAPPVLFAFMILCARMRAVPGKVLDCAWRVGDHVRIPAPEMRHGRNPDGQVPELRFLELS